MPYAAPITVLPTVVSPAGTSKIDSHGIAAARWPEFGQLFRKHAAPLQPEAATGELSEPMPGTEEFPLTQQATPGPSSLEEVLSEPPPASATANPAPSLQSASELQLHSLAQGNSTKNETHALLSKPKDLPSATFEDARISETGVVSPASRPHSTQRARHDRTETKSTGAADPLSSSAQVVSTPGPLAMATPAIESPTQPPIISVGERVQSSTTQIPYTNRVQSASEERATPQSETELIAADVPQRDPENGGNQITATPHASSNSEAAPASANSVEPKQVAQPSGSPHNSAIPHSGLSAPERACERAIPPATINANTASSHISQPEQPLSTASPIGPTPAATMPVTPSAGPLPNVYDRIDQGTSPVVIHSGPEHVAIGVHDPNLGWVEIKAQNIAGHVDAALVTSSGQAHASLVGQLPSIADSLQQRELRVATVAVHHQMPGLMGGASQNNGSGYSGAGARDSHHSGSGRSGAGGSPQPDGGVREFNPALAQSDDNHQAFRPVSYISVRA